MSERPESADAKIGDAAKDEAESNVAPEGALWFGLSGMAWALAISLALHAVIGLPFILGKFAPSMSSFDAEWAERMEELRGIGHVREQEHWAQLEDRGQATTLDEDEAEEVEEPEVEEEEAVEEEVEVEPPPEPEEAVVEKSAPKPAPKDEPKKDDEKKEKPSAQKEKQEVKVAKKSSTFDPKKPLPGVDRGGPTQIPSLKNYGPGNAAVTALVRLDRVRGTLYEDGVRQLMRKVPDFRILAGHTGLDPIRDLDSFFMASARPQYIQESFLAVRHSMSESEIKDVLDKRFREAIPWEKAAPDGAAGDALVRPLVSAASGYQDPRRVMLARPGLAVVGKDVWLDEIAQNLSADSPLRDQEDASSKSAGPAQASMLDGLAQIERVADGDDTLVLMSAQGLVYMIPGLGRMQFEGVSLKVSNPASPTTNVDLKFKDAVEAERFANSCPMLKRRLKKGLGLDGFAGMAMRAVGLGDLIDKVKCQVADEYVNINVVMTAQQLRTLAGFAAPMMPNPRVLSRLPPPPLPPPLPRTSDPAEGAGDAGVEESGADAGKTKERAVGAVRE